MTENLWIGIFLALLVELPHWTKIRWYFEDDAFGKAWQFTTVLILLCGILIYLDGGAYRALPILLTWLPLLLLPMQFVQSFGVKNSIPLNTFSFLAKQRKRRNKRLGLSTSAASIHFGNAFFVTTLIASTVGSRSSGGASWAFLPGMILLCGWVLLPKAGHRRPVALGIALTVAAGIAVAGQMGLESLENWYGGSGRKRTSFNPNSTTTMIGQIGKVEQSPEILWRLRPEADMRPPALLRTASYNSYSFGSWRVESIPNREFSDLNSLIQGNVAYYSLLPQNYTGSPFDAVRENLPRFSLRGAASAQSPLPLPGDTSSIRDFELDDIGRNAFGTVRIYPKHSVIEGKVLWRGDFYTESPPIPLEDTLIHSREKEAIDMVLAELRLNEQPTLESKLTVLRNWFYKNFDYSQTLTIGRFGPTKATPIGQFLTQHRSGHCEYFATAATLILRRCGIPARYATGYAVSERDRKRNEYVIRGTHGHAWCRVWDEKASNWVDFDTTPPSWLSIVNPSSNTTLQKFYDTIQRFREDFFIWRNKPDNRFYVTLVMSALGLCLMGFIGKNLWKSKNQLEKQQSAGGYDGVVIQTPLNALEAPASKPLGIRPPGLPLGVWLRGLTPYLTERTATLLEEAIHLHQQLRFDPLPTNESQRRKLEELAKQLEWSIKQL